MKRTVTLKPYTEDRALRAGDFSLMPINPQSPVVVSQPLKNFTQTTWIEGVQSGIPKYQTIKPTFNVINVLEGTEFSFGFRVMDPSNVNDFNDVSNLTYLWKKDDSQIYDLNRLNNGTGVSGILISSANSKSDLSGRYVCEITNRYGTVETEPLDINVIDPLTHPKIYKNLLLNGDGEGGLDGWQGSTDIIVSPFIKDVVQTRVHGSFKIGGIITWSKDYHADPNQEGVNESLTNPIDLPLDFLFTAVDHTGLFYPYYKKRLNNDPTFRDPNVKSFSTNYLNDNERWLSEGFVPNITLNEDYEASLNTGTQYPAAFFPGIAWMDRWNKNNSVIGLVSEFKNYTGTYFTRDRLKFTKFDGKPNATITQTIDLSEAADFIDGLVYGVKYTTSQFFAYVGAGITGYNIKLETTEGKKTFNYYIADAEHLYDRYYQEVNDAFPEVRQKKLGNKKYKLLPDSVIEITPIVNDKTVITLEYFDELGNLVKKETINGPNETDVWAIKEKVYFPITLLPLFLFVQPNHNPITVFGQKYTDTDALLPFFTEPSTGKGLLANSINKPVPSTIRDVAARFLMNKYNLPTNYTPYSAVESVQGRSVEECGAAAMFGVGKNIVIPYKTRSVNVSITFIHTSEIIYDPNPELKSWDKDYIYSNEQGQSTGVSQRLVEYGAPRCSITKMKFVLGPNDIEISDKYPTYSLPPADKTVLGLQKKKYTDPKAFDTSDATKVFDYEKQYLTIPQPLTEPPKPANPFILSQNLNSYIEDLNKKLLQKAASIPDSTDDTTATTINSQLEYIESLNATQLNQ